MVERASEAHFKDARSDGSLDGTTESSPAHSMVSGRFSILPTSLPTEIFGVPVIVDLNGTIISRRSLGDSWNAYDRE